ncbi:methyltransferase domain-containing protein [Epidermidibacterium keratini]|uniref:Protein-L-isoaspartate O-methyltransferase n=1 Tax=Epidermidibacterium keratini TaxID=1891644 RepID=A0A7M3T512_9ACTN|nr:methyltransferase domain-containing protein [Epidermidibacterium keratini]QHB98864.1 methyltransferase domain-containing protein [Epidermidibacterium keratini]
MSAEPDAVTRAMQIADRTGFLRSRERKHAGRDEPLPIGSGGTNSQPSTVAAMLRLLDTRAGDRVLDVGAGSGWTTAILSELVGAQGQVIGVELEPALVDFAQDNLTRYGAPHASIEQARDDVFGWPDAAPYDRILVSAMADEVPTDLIDQLTETGLMVVPVSGTMTVVRRTAGAVEVSRHGAYRFVPLRRS